MLFDGKRILVTGGTGSLVGTIIRHILTGELGRPERITIYSRDEAKQHEMRLSYMNRHAATDEIIYANSRSLLSFRVGDVRDYAALAGAVQVADIVIHAAALKQVPSCEYFPDEAVKTNINGVINLVRAIRETRAPVETVIGISTDKACKPVNVMGMTKAIMERILIEANLECPNTRFICIRYGNVVASRGSVVPLFLDQIAHGGPVTVTTPEMTRFFLTLDRAAQTVFDALAFAGRAETFVPRVPAARVMDVAETLVADRDIRIVTTGIRPGEKIHEILVSEEEGNRTTQRGEYYAILPILPELRNSENEGVTLKGEFSSAEVNLTKADLRQMLAPYMNRDAHTVIREIASAEPLR